ncbi:MAG: hypothetical protein WCK59_00865 [Candidatus Falkowbacteria bacterium]
MEKKPFHESIVYAIASANVSDLNCLALLIKSTKIPAGHEKIVTAWQKKIADLQVNDDYDVESSVLGQIKLAEKSRETFIEAIP